jgi:hypothetical protein
MSAAQSMSNYNVCGHLNHFAPKIGKPSFRSPVLFIGSSQVSSSQSDARAELCEHCILIQWERRLMAKDPEEMVHQTTQRAVEATNLGVNWIREIAEQHVDQTKNAVESVLGATRRAIDGFNRQGSAIHQNSLLLAEQTLSNSLEFGTKLAQAREPQELIRLQSEYMAKQAELLAEHAKKLERSMVQTSNEMTSMQKEVRKRSEAERQFA